MPKYITEIVIRMRAEAEADTAEDAEESTLRIIPHLLASYVADADDMNKTTDLFVEATHKDGRAIETRIMPDVMDTARSSRAIVSGSVRLPMRELMAIEEVRDLAAQRLCGELLEELTINFVEVSAGDAIVEVSGLPLPPAFRSNY